MKTKNIGLIIVIFIIMSLIITVSNIYENTEETQKQGAKAEQFKIISSTENKDLEKILLDYAKNEKINLKIEYAGTIDIMDKINSGEQYDAVWASNSIWLYMLENSSKIKNSKSISINPVVFGIKKSKARELGFIEKEVYTKDILQAIEQGKLKFTMSSATRTNTGATAYLGFLNTLAGSPEVLTKEHLSSSQIKQSLTKFFTGVTRSSGSDEFLDSMFINGDYEAVITYETSIININKRLQESGKEPLYIVYAKDGVSISDSPFAYIDNKNEKKAEEFQKIQSYLLSMEGQNELVKTGRRVWYGGINENVDKTVFNPEWGIDTTKYIVPVKYPNAQVIKEALAVYQEEFRKPVHTIFCLDYSGSMYGDGNKQLVKAMEYILTQESAKKDLLQFSSKDKITVITFSNKILNTWNTLDGSKTSQIINKIKEERPVGGTDIYTTVQKALEILEKEDMNTYNTSIILMTDGNSNRGSYRDLENAYNKVNIDIPIYSIMFGEASDKQLNEIANLTNAKVFDGRTNLLQAFKEVRGYN